MSFTVLPSGCGVCGKQQDLLRCMGRRAAMEKEEKLRNAPNEDLFLQEDPFLHDVGHFWGIWDTHDYMRARFALAESIGLIHSVELIEAKLNHLLGMLRLCRGDNMGVRDLVPAQMLRLNKDQECYDFIKWWVVVDENSRYDWADTTLPYLDIKNAGVFEPVDRFGKMLGLSHSVGVTLLKIKLLLHLMKVQQSTSSLGTTVPREILDLIQNSVPQSPILQDSPALMNEEETARSARVEILKAQIDVLFEKVYRSNKHFWPTVANPDRHLQAKPGVFSMGSVEEMQISLQYNYDAMAETPGVIDFIAKTQRKM
ncbi:hypothetical protein N7492_005197 [Penicillium capsulatum]|uniref:Uncharacterized protein n=1 Tax=Penicillium capsulatum TaxID=69766 RepID=A0A9W9I8X9_9EURO|nr:hypothetical protein N7492_005197 [Penicillium capsulatum]KAJ6135698.1 hypothetical protein N7512_000858 [Penicillium capsulatum]